MRSLAMTGRNSHFAFNVSGILRINSIMCTLLRPSYAEDVCIIEGNYSPAGRRASNALFAILRF